MNNYKMFVISFTDSNKVIRSYYAMIELDEFDGIKTLLSYNKEEILRKVEPKEEESICYEGLRSPTFAEVIVRLKCITGYSFIQIVSDEIYDIRAIN